MWQAFAQAGLTANADDPRLARYATGNALDTLKSGLSSYKNKGRILEGKLVAAPHVTAPSGSANPVSVSSPRFHGDF
jgi:hypothetical protein